MGLIKNDENQDHFWSFDKCNLTHLETGPVNEIFQINLIKQDDREERHNGSKRLVTTATLQSTHSYQENKLGEVPYMSEWQKKKNGQ